ncbi:hypothetical protein B0H13DRAFT_1875334 [Mycena leptocephala]|nr:hypothetical protein B0H13DRAFT_1875334 [Mycena leptocephala]
MGVSTANASFLFPLEPLLYHTITLLEYARAIDGYPIFTWRVLQRAIATKPASFFARSVRNVCLLAHDGLEAHMETPLSVCTGVTNLAIVPAHMEENYANKTTSLVAPLPLTHLYTHLLEPVLHTLSASSSSFTHMTHLGIKRWEFSRSPSDAEICAHLAPMPRLTHLSSEEAGLIHRGEQALDAYADHLHDLARDARFVVMHNECALEDWQMGTHVGIDYWTRTEEFVARRRSGEISGPKTIVQPTHRAIEKPPRNQTTKLTLRKAGRKIGLQSEIDV